MPLKPLQKDVDALGTDVYRDDNAAVPLMFRATLTHSIKPNQAGTNNQVTVGVKVPVVATVNGVNVSENRFECIVKFTALQNVTNDTERARCLDLAIEYLTATKANLVQGILPASVVALTK